MIKPFSSEHLLSLIKNLLKQGEILAMKFRSETFTADVKITDKDEASWGLVKYQSYQQKDKM